MNINFTFTNGRLNLCSSKSFPKTAEHKTTNLKFPLKFLNSGPSSLSISVILGYAAALEVVKLNEHLEFKVISN